MESTAAIVSAITAVFTAIFEWIIGVIPDVVVVFWAAETGLTFIGVLMLLALGVSLFFLILGLIQRFLHFRS